MYLDPDTTKIYFSKLPDCLPYIELIDEFLPLVDEIMDRWLGRHLGVIEYSEVQQTNYRGTIVLRHAPVVSLISISVVARAISNRDRLVVVDNLDPSSLWDGELTLHTGNCDCDRYSYRIKYTAGYDPIPGMVPIVARTILQKMLSTGGIDELFQSPKELVEAQNPSVGGTFKQRFARATPTGTLLDSYMSLLSDYREVYSF